VIVIDGPPLELTVGATVAQMPEHSNGPEFFTCSFGKRPATTAALISSDRADPAVRCSAVQALSVPASQDRALVSFADRQVDCPRGAGHERDGGELVALSKDAQRSVPTLKPKILDVGGTGLRNAKAVEAEEYCQSGVVAVEALGGEQERPQLGAVHAATFARMNLGSTHVLGWV